jgi:predicted naringenin-chalcone synthase
MPNNSRRATLLTDLHSGFGQVGRQQKVFLAGFRALPPRHVTSQQELLSWLVDAHVRAGGSELQTMRSLFDRYSASMEHIASRGHWLDDFTHRDWELMELFGPGGSDLAAKTRFFDTTVSQVFRTLYPANSIKPGAIIHVTCTGYASPSGAQRLVSERGWGRETEVLHAYHMGCYAAHPAVRMAAGLLPSLKSGASADVVHTELCSLHLDPQRHEPAQLVIQSLFADGCIQYKLTSGDQADERNEDGLELLAARDEIISDSTEAMAWGTGPMHFLMTLSREVPALLASALPRFTKQLMEQAGLDWAEEKSRAEFAIHPGGPRIIELSQRVLGVAPNQVRWNREVLRQHGNMSSATLPHVWQQILLDPSVHDGTIVVSIGAGPGLTLSGMVFRVSRGSER